MPVNPAYIRGRFTLGSAVAPGFLPTDLSGLMAWFKGDAGTFKDAGVTPATADGDVVKQWNDQSGNNKHATSPDNLVLKTGANGINGLPILQTISSMYLATPSIAHGIGTGNFWWLAVIKRTATTGGWQPVAANGSYAPGFYMRGSTSTHMALYNGGEYAFTSVISSAAHILEFGRASGVFSAVVDGTADATTFTSNVSIANAALDLLSDSYNFNNSMGLGEFIFYNNKPSDINLGKLRTYLNGRWAVY